MCSGNRLAQLGQAGRGPERVAPSSARLAASRTWAGVSKSGSPISRWTTDFPPGVRGHAPAPAPRRRSPSPRRPIRSAIIDSIIAVPSPLLIKATRNFSYAASGAIPAHGVLRRARGGAAALAAARASSYLRPRADSRRRAVRGLDAVAAQKGGGWPAPSRSPWTLPAACASSPGQEASRSARRPPRAPRSRRPTRSRPARNRAPPRTARRWRGSACSGPRLIQRPVEHAAEEQLLDEARDDAAVHDTPTTSAWRHEPLLEAVGPVRLHAEALPHDVGKGGQAHQPEAARASLPMLTRAELEARTPRRSSSTTIRSTRGDHPQIGIAETTDQDGRPRLLRQERPQDGHANETDGAGARRGRYPPPRSTLVGSAPGRRAPRGIPERRPRVPAPPPPAPPAASRRRGSHGCVGGAGSPASPSRAPPPPPQKVAEPHRQPRREVGEPACGQLPPNRGECRPEVSRRRQSGRTRSAPAPRDGRPTRRLASTRPAPTARIPSARPRRAG